MRARRMGGATGTTSVRPSFRVDRGTAGTIRRVSAEAIESLVEGSLRQGLPKKRQVEWAELSSAQKREQVERLIERVTIMAASVELRLTEVGRSLVGAEVRVDTHRYYNEV